MTADALRWERAPERLRDPALVFAFSGWNDAGQAASAALAAAAGSVDAELLAAIDAEAFYDFQVVRPTIDLSEPDAPVLTWPEVRLLVARPTAGERDLVFLTGGEPSHRWRTFCELVLGAADQLGVRHYVGLGSLLADVAHTRPVSLTGITSSPALVEGMGFRPPTYRGPTGIVGVIHAMAADAGHEAVSLWAPVPHYLSSMPNPKGALALMQALAQVVGVPFDITGLQQATVAHEREVAAAIERDPDAQALVERLEQAADEQMDPGTHSGDSIADEIERFLRQRETGSEDS